MCKLGSIWPQKSDLLSGVQQANNDTLKRDIDYLFLRCSSLGTWSYSRNQTPQLSKLFTIYIFANKGLSVHFLQVTEFSY